MTHAISLSVRGRTIRVDDDGFVCVTDVWKASGHTKNQRPTDFVRLPQFHGMATALHEKLVGKSHQFKTSRVWRTGTGPAGGTYAHPVMALAYAEYLSPKLAVEVREVFLRYKAADATLADDILERASAEANEWAGTRALGRVARKEYVDSLIAHDVTQPGIGRCTNGIYQGLFNTTAHGLRKQLGMKSGTPRDKFSTADLAYTMAAEMLAKEDIEESNHRGDDTCHCASIDAARAIGGAIEQNRTERRRQGKLPF